MALMIALCHHTLAILRLRSRIIKNKTDLDIVVSGPEVGLSILASKNLREVYSFGHFEYDRDTLAREYRRDLDAGINPDVPATILRG